LKTQRTERPGARPDGNRGTGPKRRDDGRPTSDRRDGDRRGAPGGRGYDDRGRGGQRGGPRPPVGGRPRTPYPAGPRIPAGRELIYGRNGVFEAFRGRRVLHRLLLAEGIREDGRIRALIAAAAERDIVVDRVPREMLDDLTGANHQGVALEVDPFVYADIDEILSRPGTVLILDHLQDPQNFGALIRAAETAGASGVILPEDRSAAVTPAVVNASAGAVELLPVAAVPNLANAIKALRGAGWWIAALDSGSGSTDLFETDVPLPLALIVGSEGAGVSPLLRKTADLVLALPMAGRIESLNAATAGAIAIYDIFRRQRSQLSASDAPQD
jgi:23S rRNA (guanosine2251-2'-O)-methyltransferase